MTKRMICLLILILFNGEMDSFSTIGTDGAPFTLQAFIAMTAGASTVNGYAFMSGGFSLPGSTSSLLWHSYFPCQGPITLNGATLTLNRGDFVLFGNATLINGGIFVCNGFSVQFPHDNSPFSPGSTPSTFNGGNVSFNSPVALSTTLTFQGTSILNGNGNIITFASAAAISVASGGSLLIQNATLQGISASQLACQDNTGVLSLQNVTIVQDGDFTFTLGIMNILNDVEFTGSSVFAFRSTNSLNINSYSTLMFDAGSTFSYDTTNASLLKFSDVTAQLFLNGATLAATGTGINLTKGTLNVDSNSFFASTGTLGVTIGSCVSANDLQVNMFNNSQLTVNQGLLNYKNVNAASFNMFNSFAQLSMGAGTTLNVYRSLNGLGSVIFGNNTTLGTSPGASLLISSLQQGTISFSTLPSC
ncbi:MAG: hypothetical protein P4L31_00355 [Candidatus Babeliales bacterium]|nr:hypothetical protein [Candidatus Babeliales bacterium]